jgi:hypothetical protein
MKYWSAFSMTVGRSLRPTKRSIAARSNAAVRREFLCAVGAPARVDDGGDVVGGEMALDELSRGVDDDLRARRADVEIVEHDHVQPAADRCAFDRTSGTTGAAAADSRAGRHRNIDRENVLIAWGLPSSNRAKSSLAQPRDEIPALVGDHGVDVDVVHLDLEGDRRRRGLLSGRDGDQQNAGDRDDRREMSDPHRGQDLMITLGRMLDSAAIHEAKSVGRRSRFLRAYW